MYLNSKTSISRRYVKTRFDGFKPTGKNPIKVLFTSWSGFFSAFLRYFGSKLAWVFFTLNHIIFWLIGLPGASKSYLIKKLIWSRGKLGRPISATFILALSLGAFMLGEVFSGSTFVVEPAKANTDYLTTTGDIIPRKEIALTTLPESRQRTEAFVYKIEPGDTLYSIGQKFKVSLDALKYVNGLYDSSILKVGSDLTIPPIAGLIHKVGPGDTLASIGNKYDVPPQSIADFNYLLDPSKLPVGTELVVPGANIPQPVIILPPVDTGPSYGSSPATPSKSYCVWPTTVRIITQGYSWHHNGADIATPINGPMPPLLACTGGTVTRSGWDPFGLGLHIRIDHGNGYETIYGHMSRLDVSYGEKVKRGQVLGLMGSTGNSTGPHVHFMVTHNGVVQNPFDYMN